MEAALKHRLRQGLALLAVSWAASAAAEQDAGLAACAEIADAAERLACYDRVAAPRSVQEPAVAVPATAGQTTAEPATVSPPSGARKTASADAPATEAPAASRASEPPAEQAAPERNAAGVAVEQLAAPRRDVTAAATDAEAAEEPRKRGFLRRLLRRDRSPDKPDAEDEPVAAGEIVRVAKLPLGNYQLTLDDGQVWRENERETHTSYAVGDRIKVLKGAFGTFNLTNERTGQSIKARPVRK